MSDSIENKISELAESVLSTTDFFLVDVEIKGNKKPEIWIYVDGEDRGVNMDECADISNELSFLMDAHDVFSGSYRLNVSSPGLSRPLVDKRQYAKNEGRRTKVKYKRDNEYLKTEGTLKSVSEDKVVIEQEDGTSNIIDFDDVVETKIIPSLK